MGEYATYRGSRVKIGTCEDMYYLRADQRHEVAGCDGDWASVRFRFPWPDEDGIEPGGAFADHRRRLALPGVSPPAELAGEHHRVQFVASQGYNVCLPCPESGEEIADHQGAAFTVHRNGFAGPVCLVQQRLWKGSLVAVVECGGCGLAWRLETLDELRPVLDALSLQACRRENDSPRSGEWYATVADRAASGYVV